MSYEEEYKLADAKRDIARAEEGRAETVTIRRCIYAACLTFAVFVATIGGCVINKQRAVRDMVLMGADPIKAHCSIYMGEGSDMVCQTTILAK